MKLFSKSILLLALLCLIACGEESKTNTATEPKTVAEAPAQTTLEALKDPCEILTKADMESIEGFQEVSEGKANLASSDTWKICDFTVNRRGMGVSLKRYNQRIIETKGVERTYQKNLAIEDELTRREVPSAPGDQAIYTYGHKGLNHTYVLQWRYENHTEGMISISFGDEQNADAILKQLVAVASKLDA